MNAEARISGEDARLAILQQIIAGGSRRSEVSPVVLGVEGLDDAALLRVPSGELLVVSTDFVRGTGFHLFALGKLNHFDVGYYLIMANASDLAAMGATPLGATTVVRYTENMTDIEFTDVFRGMKSAADACRFEIVGGDIGGHSSDVYVATIMGAVRADSSLRRSGARAGDVLCVTGVIGRPITALTYFKKAKPAGLALPKETEERLLDSWRRPVPRLVQGQILSSLGSTTACQDISDGLAATINQLGRASGVSFRVHADKIAIDPGTIVVADFLKTEAINLAMSASVDFELLFTVRREDVVHTLETIRSTGCTVAIIGEAIDQDTNIFIREDGTQTQMPGIAWQQQTGDFIKDIVDRGISP